MSDLVSIGLPIGHARRFVTAAGATAVEVKVGRSTYIIDTARGQQTNKRTSFTRPVAVCWQNERNEWHPYPDEVCSKLVSFRPFEETMERIHLNEVIFLNLGPSTAIQTPKR